MRDIPFLRSDHLRYPISISVARKQPGSQDIRFRVRVWVDALHSCQFRITNLKVRGPADKPVTDAFK